MWPDANIGIATGDGLVVLDVDPRHDGDTSLEKLEAEYGEIVTRSVRTGGGGLHLYLHGDLPSRGAFLSGLDLKAAGGYVVAPPSLHVSGQRYTWVDRGEGIRVVPDWLTKIVRASRSQNGKAGPLPDTIPSGQRNNTLASAAGTMRRRGMSEAAILAALEEENATRCVLPLPADEVAGIAHTIATNYDPAPVRLATKDDSLTLTDTGNASRFVTMQGDRLRYIAPWREWLVFDSARGAWIRDHADVRVRELAKDVGSALKKVAAAPETDAPQAKKLFAFALKSLNKHGITGMVDLARGVDGIPLDHEQLDRDGIPEDRTRLDRSLDLRYLGQGYEMRIPLSREALDSGSMAEVWDSFHERHRVEFGHHFPSNPIEIVNLRVTGSGLMPELEHARFEGGAGTLEEAHLKSSETYFRVDGRMEKLSSSFYDRSRIPVGGVVEGPAVILQHDSTTVLLPGSRATIEESGNMIIDTSRETA